MEECTDVDTADVAQEIVELLVRLSCFVLRILRADQMEQATSTFTMKPKQHPHGTSRRR